MTAAAVSAKKWKATDNGRRSVQCLFTPSSSYLTATPSENVTLASLGLKRVEYIYLPTVDLLDPSLPLTAAATKRGFSVTLVPHTVGDTSVALRFWETDATEVADAVDKSTKTFYIVFVGV